MQHGWLGKPSHPFMPACHPFMPARVASSAVQQTKHSSSRQSTAQADKAPDAGPHLHHLHPKSSGAGTHLHPKSSVAYENTRLNYREGTILPVFTCICLRLPVFACACLHSPNLPVFVCLDAAVGGRLQARIAGHPSSTRRNHQLPLVSQYRHLSTVPT